MKTMKKLRVSGVGSIGSSCRRQKVRYDCKAEEYDEDVAREIEFAIAIERSCTSRSRDQATRVGCLVFGLRFIRVMPPAKVVGV